MSISSLVRNVLAIIGVVALIGVAVGYAKVQSLAGQLDPEAVEVFSAAGARYMESLDPGTTMVKTIPVKEGIPAEDVVESMKSLAVQQGMLFVGESPFYKQVEAVTGKPFRFVAFYSFCDAMVGVKMIEYNSAYSAFMPCRISLVEDPEGRLWLHMMDLDLMIYGGKPLPPDVKEGAIRVRDSLDKILKGAAAGEF
jgi:uncharacterized protein (DUF302 family)